MSRTEPIFYEVGKLAIAWNNLEWQLRRVAFSLTDDWFTVALLTIDLQAANLIQAIRLLTTEHDAEIAKANRFIEAARPVTQHKVRSRDLVSEHVNCLLNCADRLRLYRNLYVHCVSASLQSKNLVLGGITTRGTSGRLSEYEFPIKLEQMRKVTSGIESVIRYGKKIQKCIEINQRSRLSQVPPWPKKLALYPELRKPYSAIADRMPLF